MGVGGKRDGGLIQFSEDGVIASPWRPRMQSGKAQVLEVGGHAAEVQRTIPTFSRVPSNCDSKEKYETAARSLKIPDRSK